MPKPPKPKAKPAAPPPVRRGRPIQAKGISDWILERLRTRGSATSRQLARGSRGKYNANQISRTMSTLERQGRVKRVGEIHHKGARGCQRNIVFAFFRADVPAPQRIDSPKPVDFTALLRAYGMKPPKTLPEGRRVTLCGL
jgi:hypothetical protein